MNEIAINSLAFGVVVTIAAYELGVLLKKKFKHTLFNPILIAIIAIICFLLVFDVEYDSYMLSAKYLSYLITPLKSLF